MRALFPRLIGLQQHGSIAPRPVHDQLDSLTVGDETSIDEQLPGGADVDRLRRGVPHQQLDPFDPQRRVGRRRGP